MTFALHARIHTTYIHARTYMHVCGRRTRTRIRARTHMCVCWSRSATLYATFRGSKRTRLRFNFCLAHHTVIDTLSMLRFIVSFQDDRDERQFILQLTL